MKPFTLGVLLGRAYREQPETIDELFRQKETKTSKPVKNIQLETLLPQEEPFKSLARAVAEGDPERTAELIKEALKKGIDALEAVTEGLIPGIEAISELYNRRLAYVPEILLADRALRTGMQECGTALKDIETKGTVMAHTAEGDIHDIGKNIVVSIVEAKGYHVIDLGVSVDSNTIINATQKHRPLAIIGSSLMTTTRTGFHNTADQLKKQGLEPVFIIGGGACDEEFAEQKDLLVYARNPLEVLEILELAGRGMNWRQIRKYRHTGTN